MGGSDPGDEPLALRSGGAARRRVEGGPARRLRRGRGGGGCAGPRSVRRLRGGLRGDHPRARAARLQLTRPVGADSPPVTDLPTSATRLIALLGNPVAHSISPIFQNAAFRHAGVDGVYLALRCEGAAVPGLLRGIALAGGGGNVTVPHKEVAAQAVDEPTEAVRRTGACNTFWSEGDRIRGDNTDVVGSARAIEALLGGSAAGARVLLVGSGGAARAALAALADGGAGEVVLLNRTRGRAEALAALFHDAPFRARVAEREEELPDGSFDLAINT